MATTRSTVQSVLDRYVQAVKASDADALLALYSDDVHVYDLMEPFERHGNASQRELMEAWLNEEGVEQDCVIEDVNIMQDGDLAVARASVRYSATKPGDEQEWMWNRAPWALRRETGEWKIIHEHTSVPLSAPDMQPIYDGRGT